MDDQKAKEQDKLVDKEKWDPVEDKFDWVWQEGRGALDVGYALV